MEGIFALCTCRTVSMPKSLMVRGRGPAHRPGCRLSMAGAEHVRCRAVGDEARDVGKAQTPSEMNAIKCAGAKIEVCTIETLSC